MKRVDASAGPRKVIQRLTAGEEARVAGLGDSLTYGWMVRRGFFDRFCDALSERYPKGTLTRVNEGVPGDTALGALMRVRSLMAHRPHVVLVQFGLNDMFTGADVSSYGDALSRIIETVRERGAEPLLVVSCPLALPEHAAMARPFYDAIRDLGSEHHVAVADLDRHWRERHDLASAGGALFLDDGVHPDDAGHAVMAEGLLAEWERLVAGSASSPAAP